MNQKKKRLKNQRKNPIASNILIFERIDIGQSNYYKYNSSTDMPDDIDIMCTSFSHIRANGDMWK